MKNKIFANHDEGDILNTVTWTTNGDLNSGSSEHFDTWEEALVWSFEKALELAPCELTLDSPKFRHYAILVKKMTKIPDVIEKCNFKIQCEGVPLQKHCPFKNGNICDGEENCILFQIYRRLVEKKAF